MKRKIETIAIVASLLALLAGCQLRCPTIVGNPDPSNLSDLYLSNRSQYNSSVWMGTVDDELFFYPHCGSTANRSCYDGYLSVFGTGDARKITDLESGKRSLVLIGSSGTCLYYCDMLPYPQNNKLYCFDCSTETETLLHFEGGNVSQARSIWYAEDGSVYIPLEPCYQEPPVFLHIMGSTLIGKEYETDGYTLGDWTYRVCYNYGDGAEQIIRSGADGSQEAIPFPYADHRSLIPVDNGLLVHNEGSPDILYLIESDGTVQSLFSRPCMCSRSCITICGDSVYLSMLRYEKYGEKGMCRFRDDTEEGTYKISLSDYSVLKLTDKIYDGLYNFDDSSIYACDEACNIYRLNYDGEVLSSLFRVS